MYIYQLPFEINKDLCRLLDNDDVWSDLAGRMNYSAFEVNEIEQQSKRQVTSPTNMLLIRWGQLNHKVEELFILLYKMKHVPAMKCLAPIMDSKFQKLLNKIDSCNGVAKDTATVEDIKRYKAAPKSESIPLPVMLIGKNGNVENLKKTMTPSNSNGQTPTDDSSTDASKIIIMSSGNPVDVQKDLMKNVHAIPMISYHDLKECTNNWAEDNLLGKGGFGQVYKGEFKCLPVAVKKLKGNDKGKNDIYTELIRELCLNQYRHDNILPLYGYSLGGPETCLVYQLMEWSLDQRLRCKKNNPPLTWSQRFTVAHGVARGLAYLHTMTRTPLIHGDIKPANILLDSCITPKIGDFGLARRGCYEDSRTHMKVSKVHGTRPYLPEEYVYTHNLSSSVDVFSYGVVILEIATCEYVLDKNRTHPLLTTYVHERAKDIIDLAILEDQKLRNTSNSNPQLCREFIIIGLHCTKKSGVDRPTMLEVYNRLVNIGKQYNLQRPNVP